MTEQIDLLERCRPTNTSVIAADKRYFESGTWKCDKSPTGAHQNIEKPPMTLTCQCCGRIRKVQRIERYPHDQPQKKGS